VSFIIVFGTLSFPIGNEVSITMVLGHARTETMNSPGIIFCDARAREDFQVVCSNVQYYNYYYDYYYLSASRNAHKIKKHSAQFTCVNGCAATAWLCIVLHAQQSPSLLIIFLSQKDSVSHWN